MLNQLGPALSNHFDLGNDLNLYRGIANAADIGGGTFRAVEIDVSRHYIGAMCGKSKCDGASIAIAGSGHEGTLTGQQSLHARSHAAFSAKCRPAI